MIGSKGFPIFLVTILAARLPSVMSKVEPIDNVLVVIAMEAEANPFIEYVGLKRTNDFFPPEAPFHSFEGEHEDCQITLVTAGKDHVYGTGVDNCGTVPAALATFLALQEKNDTHLVINAGTCGGFKRKGAEIGDVYLTTGVAHHDRRIPIPSFTPYGIGKLDTIDAPALAKAHGFKTGVITTGNSLDKTEEDDKAMKENDATLKDMEAAAIAWSSELFKKPYLGVKVVTDIVDGEHPTEEEFLRNLQSASKSLQEALPQVIEHVCGKHHHEL